jgi:S-DNA-T family DNA segregation ATPase FtsK/SpoIIIE
MGRRYGLLDESLCDNLAEHNRENPGATVPYIVAVFDEYAEMISSFAEKQDRESFESAIGRLAQKARAAGIHLIVCMQRPDVNAIKGAIKSNIAHRFALKLPQSQDSRVILDENGAETLLGQGDLLYKDSNNRITRLQVPFLEGSTLKRHLQRVLSGSAPRAADPALLKTCPKCGATGPVAELFGMRRTRHTRKDGVEVSVERPQSYCRSCRGGGAD